MEDKNSFFLFRELWRIEFRYWIIYFPPSINSSGSIITIICRFFPSHCTRSLFIHEWYSPFLSSSFPTHTLTLPRSCFTHFYEYIIRWLIDRFESLIRMLIIAGKNNWSLNMKCCYGFGKRNTYPLTIFKYIWTFNF